MFTFLIVLILVIAILMSVTVLLQSGKGGGLSGIAGGQTTQILGARQAPDLLEKATWALGSAFLFLTVATTFVTPGSEVTDPSAFEQAAEDAPDTAPAVPLPTAPSTEVPGGTITPDASGEAAPAEETE
jgi:preprotein translocase subunit SecG